MAEEKKPEEFTPCYICGKDCGDVIPFQPGMPFTYWLCEECKPKVRSLQLSAVMNALNALGK